MDNLETTEIPVGSDGATSSPDNISTETQTDEAPEAVSAPESAEAVTTYPWEKDARFKGKTPEEMTEIISEADRYKGELSQKAEIIHNLEEHTGMSLTQIAEAASQQRINEQRQRYADNPLAPVLDEVNNLKQKIEAQEQEKALAEVEKDIDTYIASNNVYAPFKDQIKQLALTEGIGFINRFNPITGQNEIVDVPTEDIALKFFGKAIAQGEQAAYKKIEVKKNTQTTGVVSTPKKGVTLDDMKNMSAAEMRAILQAKQG
jgi:hypothetical protein